MAKYVFTGHSMRQVERTDAGRVTKRTVVKRGDVLDLDDAEAERLVGAVVPEAEWTGDNRPSHRTAPGALSGSTSLRDQRLLGDVVDDTAHEEGHPDTGGDATEGNEGGGDEDESDASELRGQALEDALNERGLPHTGTADEKRARVAEYDAENA